MSTQVKPRLLDVFCCEGGAGGSSDRAHAKDVRRGGYTPGRDVRAALIGADWMTLHGLSQAIPPAYTEWLGAQLLLEVHAVAS